MVNNLWKFLGKGILTIVQELQSCSFSHDAQHEVSEQGNCKVQHAVFRTVNHAFFYKVAA